MLHLLNFTLWMLMSVPFFLHPRIWRYFEISRVKNVVVFLVFFALLKVPLRNIY